MQKICVLILLSALASNYEAVPQTKWSRPVRNPQGQLTRERRQFPFGEWVPLSQPCPTCRPFADPLDAGLRGENIGLTPPRPPTVTRQIHGEGNFFSQDESSILSVPPPPPSAIPRHPIPNGNGNFQFTSFGQQFNNPLPVPTQKIFPQTQQIQFLPQTFLPNQPLLVNGNQQILSGLNTQTNLFGHQQNQQQVNSGKVAAFNSEFKSQKIPENVVLEQNKRPVAPKQAFPNKPQPFTTQQQNQQTSVNQQAFNGQQQHSVNFENSILTPPPAPKNVTQDIVIPGLDKEEIQLLYVPVETLRQRGTPQEQLLTQHPQNIQFYNRQNGLQRPANNARPTEQTVNTQPKGHFITQNGNSQGQTDSSLKVTSTQIFPTTVTPSSLLLQHLPFQTPQPFVSATPATPTVQPFGVTPASVFQKFSPFTPETTLPHLSTVPNSIQFTQSAVEFGTTPKTIASQGGFTEEIISGKSQFSGLKSTGLPHGQETPLQSFSGQQAGVTQQPQLTTVFSQEQQKELLTPTHFPLQIDQQQISIQKQQEQQHILQQQRQKELEEQRFLEQQRKQKELEEQRLLQQQQRQKELEQQRFLQKQKELEEQRQKELEQQRFLQKQKEIEEQRLLQQRRQKELEQQRLLQKQKEIEEQRLLQQRRQKELEQQRFFQKQRELEEQRLWQQRQKDLEEQRYLQEQRQKELENQRRLQLQKQKELDEKRRLQLKQKEDEERLLRFQQQQKELQQQRLLQQQQEEHERELQQQKLQKQKQENLKKQQQFQFFQQQQQQQQQQQKQTVAQQGNRHVLPANDNLNFIPQLEKESETEDQQLVPHQPPLSVFFKGHNGAEVKITDVLRELRSSNTITVLDQYFEKMPTVFVGPAGLIPPSGYGKFDLPYLSNIESNRIERRIDKLPFFVAPLNFVPPPGYAKIPFPAPHVGSVVVSSESNPAMNLKTNEKGSSVEENSGSFPVVGPELPGLINNLDTIITTTIKPTTYTPSLPQTTAQLRNRRPNNSIYKPQSRKPISRTRPTTTSKPEEEVTQPIQKAEVTKEPEGVFRKPFNRFLNRRRQQTKTTTEIPLKGQQDGKSLENRHYSVESYNQEENQFSRTQQKSDVINEKPAEGQFNRHFEQHSSSLERITPGGQEVFEVRPTPDFSKSSQIEAEGRRPEISDYSDVNLQSYEDGPLPTGSAKTITHELYRPNAINQAQEINPKVLSKPDSTQGSVQFQPSAYEEVNPTKLSEISDASPTPGVVEYQGTSEGQVNLEQTSIAGYEKQDVSSERFDTTEVPRNRVSYTPDPVSSEQQTKGYFDSNEQYTSAFAEISKPHHIPGYTESSRHPNSNVHPTQQISVDLEAPLAQTQQSQGYSQVYDSSAEVRPTSSSEISDGKFAPTGSSNEQYLTGFEAAAKNEQSVDISASQVSPTAPGATETQYTTDHSANSQSSVENNRQYEDQRIGSFISVQNVHSTAEPQQYYQTSSAFPSQAPASDGGHAISVEQSPPQISSTHEPVVEVTANPSVQTYSSGSEGIVNVRQQQTAEGQGQDVADNLSNDHRIKLPNPAIVRVRTRVRGKSRGQVNFAASQTTTHAPLVRSTAASRHTDNTEQEYTTKSTHFREYNPVKISKYNQFRERGVKKPLRSTTEATVRTTTDATEYEQKANVYTVRPHRRPLNPSTVSTKRIRRPTTPLPSAEAVTEAFGISTPESHSHSEHPDISPSGVSNDVYYEQSSLTPTKHKFRKHFGTAEQKNDVVPAYVSTSYPSVAPSYSTFVHDTHSEGTHLVKDLTHTEAAEAENSEKYPEWNPSESGIDVSGIVLTTIRTPGQQQEEQVEEEEPKKIQDNKKAFDPDLEKKTGRRRVRVRVHKRPHENFETAESQNLRTVANVLVPPTTTYKPNDESSFHQLAKNADFSFGGQKLFGIRSREYFRKRLNLTQSEGVSTGKGEQTASENVTATEEAAERPAGSKVSGFLRKAQKNEFEYSQANETSDGGKVVRPKFRGFVRKIIKHGGANKETDSEPNQLVGAEENEKHEDGELHSKQTFRVNQGGFNHAARVNGTRHKTFVRYVKKNKIKHHETESHQESSSEEVQKEQQGLHQTTESHTEGPQVPESRTTEDVREEKQAESQFPVYQVTEQTHNVEPQEQETTEEPEAKAQSSTQTTPTESAETYESSSLVFQESSSQHPPTPLTQITGLYLTQRPKFYQTLRPVFQRTNGFQRTREPESHSSTTEQSVQEPQEKRNGFARLKYGKTTGFGSTANEKSDEIKKVTEQQLKNKNLHTLEVRKYLRTKIREGGFSQFSKNKYFTSEKTETAAEVKEQENEQEETTTERAAETTSVEPKTTQAIVAHTDPEQVENETTEDESELHVTTTEAISSSEEEDEEESSEEEVTDSVILGTTTEIPTTVYRAPSSPEVPTTIFQVPSSPEVPTTVFQTTSSHEIPTTVYQAPDSPETPEVTEVKTTTIQTTEAADSQRTEYEPDIYRFSKHSFSFDEAEKFTGTKNRAHVRNITTDIIENTASFSAPGVEKRPEIRVVTHRFDEGFPTATESQDSTQKEKTEATTTELNGLETTTDYPETTETATTASTDAVTKAKIAKILKTSTTTKVSHETEICYRGRCIRTKSENPDEDLKLLVDSASTMKIEKTKRGTS